MLTNPNDRWSHHRELVERCLQVSFLDPYAGVELGPGKASKLDLRFDDAAENPVTICRCGDGLEIIVSSELYLRAHGAALALTRCQNLRPYPSHFVAPSLTRLGLSRALGQLLRWRYASATANEDVAACLEGIGYFEAHPTFSVLGSESEVMTFLALLAAVTFSFHDYLLREIHLTAEQLATLDTCVCGRIQETLDLVTLMVLGAGLADQLKCDLQNLTIFPGTRRFTQRVVQFAMLCALSSSIARSLLRSADSARAHPEAFGVAWDIVMPLHFRDTLAILYPESDATLAHAAFLRGVSVFADAAGIAVEASADERRFADWRHDLAAISVLLRDRVDALQGTEGVGRVDRAVADWQKVKASMDLNLWKRARDLFDPSGPISIDTFSTDRESAAL